MTPDILRHRAKINARIRAFFSKRQVTEVSTPCITPYAVSDVHIQSLELNTLPKSYLRTSPEPSHKWLLAHGMGDLYEMGPVFRAGERGQYHQPEFTLLEWYRLGMTWQDLAQEVVDLIHHTAKDWHAPWPVRFISWAEACVEYLGINLETTPSQDWQALLPTEANTWSSHDQMDYLFATKVQALFPQDQITVVHDYPLHQKALAQLSEDGLHAKRFEVFIGTLELANGYQELTDAKAQRARFEEDLAYRQQHQRPISALDERLLGALEHGLPPCSGVALGVDRLVMSILGLAQLSDGYTLTHDHAMVCAPKTSSNEG